MRVEFEITDELWSVTVTTAQGTRHHTWSSHADPCGVLRRQALAPEVVDLVASSSPMLEAIVAHMAAGGTGYDPARREDLERQHEKERRILEVRTPSSGDELP